MTISEHCGECRCSVCTGEITMNRKYAEKWVRQFNGLSASRRKEMIDEVTEMLDRLEREARTELPSAFSSVEVDTYWFDRRRQPRQDEVRPWEFHVTYEDLGGAVYKDDREYGICAIAARHFAFVNSNGRKLKSIVLKISG